MNSANMSICHILNQLNAKPTNSNRSSFNNLTSNAVPNTVFIMTQAFFSFQVSKSKNI